MSNSSMLGSNPFFSMFPRSMQIPFCFKIE